MTDVWVVLEGMLPYLLVLVGLIVLFLVIREVRLMYTGTRLAQLELEREKINLMKADMEQKGRPFYRIPPKDLEELRMLDEENV